MLAIATKLSKVLILLMSPFRYDSYYCDDDAGVDGCASDAHNYAGDDDDDAENDDCDCHYASGYYYYDSRSFRCHEYSLLLSLFLLASLEFPWP